MIVKEPDSICVICGAQIPEGRQVCPICGTKDDVESYAKLIRKDTAKPEVEFKVDDKYEQSFRQGYLTGFNEGMKAACELKQQNEQLRRRNIILEQQANRAVYDIDAEYE